MRLLMTNFALANVGGTEKWTWTMAQEFQRRGWEVEAFTFHAGEVADRLRGAGVTVVTELPPGRVAPCDLILVNHNLCWEFARHVPGPKVFTSHGPRNPLEVPPPGADRYVAVTPEVAAAWAFLGHDFTVITNGVDLEEFRPNGPPQAPPRVLSMCKLPAAVNIVATACDRLGLPFDAAHYVQRPVWDISDKIRAADVVVGCGRSAYEALACGKEVLVFDARDKKLGPRADGWITEANVDALYARNCACRSHNLPWDVVDVEGALQALPGGSWQRGWAEEHCDVRQKVDAYLELIS